MRGDDEQSGHLFSYLSPEQRVPACHPLRAIRTMTDEALRRLVAAVRVDVREDGPAVHSAEHLLRALLIQVLYSVRSERMLMEQLEYNLLFRWFVGLGMDDAVWAPTTFTKNRDWLLDGDIARAFFEDVVDQARGRRLLSAEHFTIDGTLLEAWAGQKSFKRKDQPREPPDDPGNSDGQLSTAEKRSNQTQPNSTTADPREPLVQEGEGPRSQARVPRRSLDGESARPGRRCLRRPGDRHRRARRGDQPRRRSAVAPRDHPGGDTRPTTPAASSSACGSSRRRRTSRAKRRAGRSTDAPHGTPATTSVSGSANASRKSLAG